MYWLITKDTLNDFFSQFELFADLNRANQLVLTQCVDFIQKGGEFKYPNDDTTKVSIESIVKELNHIVDILVNSYFVNLFLLLSIFL